MRIEQSRHLSHVRVVTMTPRLPKLFPLPPGRGIVHAPRPDGLLEGRRVAPSPALAAFIHHFWLVEWRLRSPFRAETLPHPAARITFEESHGKRHAEIVGVPTGRLSKELEGRGRWFGIQFRPVMFQPLLRAPMVGLTDRAVTVEEVFGPSAAAWERAIHGETTLIGKMAHAEAFLLPLLRPTRSSLVGLRDLVERMASDRTLLRVEDAADALSTDSRGLQRRFRRFVGVSPKWVIRRYRLHEALEQLKAKSPPKLADLAASLGYADQAHFARELNAAVGRTPGSFMR